MPMYTYRREDGTTFDYKQSFSDDPLETCPTTGQDVVRVVQAAGIIFKGSGFYVNDSKNSSKSAVNGTNSHTNGSSDNGSSDSSSTTTESSTKSDTSDKGEKSEKKAEKPEKKVSPKSETKAAAD